MKVLQPSFEILEPLPRLTHIERCGRTCYKSEDRITHDSSGKFVQMLLQNGHTTVLEHSSYIFDVGGFFYKEIRKYIEVVESKGVLVMLRCTHDRRFIVSGNVRAWIDFLDACAELTGHLPSLFRIDEVVTNTEKLTLFGKFYDLYGFNGFGTLDEITKWDLDTVNEKMVHWDESVRFIGDRGFTHEVVRHRISSPSQESTRYCNYGAGKFGNEISVIDICNHIQDLKVSTEDKMNLIGIWYAAMEFAEQQYMAMIELGAPAQIARSVLPQSTKAEIVITANLREWVWIFTKRCAPAAHPQMRELMLPLLTMFQTRLPEVFLHLTTSGII